MAGSSDTKRRFNVLFNAAHLYRLRVREQPLQELFAVLGIAAGVALLFAVQVASTSITGSVRQLASGITGNASLELAARGTAGMDQATVANARTLPAVKEAAPVLQQRIAVVGPAGVAQLTLVGVDRRLEKVGGSIVRRFSAKRRDLGANGLFLTEQTADAIGAVQGDRLTIEAGAHKRELPLAGTLGANEIGGVKASPIAIAPLGMAQRITGMQGRISRILIEPESGEKGEATAQLKRLVNDRLDVRPSGAEADLLAEALKPDQQSSAIFSAIAVIIGVLFAYNAMLLAEARRRRTVAYLRILGADRATVTALLVFEAVVLGLAASFVGILLGDVVSRFAFQSVPDYLASGFPIGPQRVIGVQTVVLSLVGGLAAAMVASTKPAIDLYRVSPGEAISERAPARREDEVESGAMAFWAGLGLIGLGGFLAHFWPSIIPIALGSLILGLAIALGPVLHFVFSRLNRVTRAHGDVAVALAVDELYGSRARATALAVIAAGSVTAVLSIGGASLDLQRGVYQLTHGFYSESDIWVVRRPESNVFLTQDFEPEGAMDALKRQTEVRSTSVYPWSFLDVAERRVLLVARPPSDRYPVSPSQIIQGDAQTAAERIRSGGWAAMSKAVMERLGGSLGGQVKIPTPSGNRVFRVAAITANHGWPSGAITINANDERRFWASDRASAIGVKLAPGVTEDAGRRAVSRALGSNSALWVQTGDEMVAGRMEEFGQGMTRLRQISIMVLMAAVLAIVAAMFASVWQRRARLASLRAIGMYRGELFRTLLVEMALVVVIGGAAGLVVGVYGQFYAGRWTQMTSGYLADFEPAIGFGLVTVAKATALAVLATAVPAFFASRVAPRADTGI